MAEGDIKVILSVMENCSKSFSNSGQTVVQIAEHLAAAMASMRYAWDDPAQKSFEESFGEMVQEFEKVNACLNAMSSFSAYVAECYRTADQTAKSLL